MVIRRYTPADSGRLFQMMRDEGSEWADYYEDEDRHRVTLERSLTYLAFDGERLCGYIRCREDDGYGVFVYDLLVDQACRGQNLGRRLMAHVRREYPGQPLYVMSDNDEYYEKQGFKAIGTVFEAPSSISGDGDPDTAGDATEVDHTLAEDQSVANQSTANQPAAASGSMNALVREYTRMAADGRTPKAYKGILTFMSDLRASLAMKFPNHAIGAIYPGYMDMTYFSFTPASLVSRKLKVAVVYLHGEGRFEAWLAAANRQVQSTWSRELAQRDLGGYVLSPIGPGVDSIIATVIAEQPDFDSPETLKRLIEDRLLAFAADLAGLVD